MAPLSRRSFIQSGLVTAGALSFGPAFWRDALAASPVTKATVGPYGALQAPDANGIMLPKGFTSREVARSLAPVPGTSYVFPVFPDGSATFATPDGGWILAVNTEAPGTGGASSIRFDKTGQITDAYRILDNTSLNCAGGPTPWGTWLSCEEIETGLVWECDPTGVTPAIARPALGAFKHEAACVDPNRQQLYLSEDLGGSGLYRFTPEAYPDLSDGLLEIATNGKGGKVVWKKVPDPSAASAPTRTQVENILPFARGEGIWFDSGIVYLATTADETIHAYDTHTEKIEILYRADDVKDTPLRGVDNIHVSRSGDLYVAEDSYSNDPDALDVCIISPEREVSRFLKLTGEQHRYPNEAESETVGLCFDPSGRRLYFGSQRGFGFGVVYEVTGPFRQSRPPGTPGAGTPLGLDVAKRLRLRAFGRKGLPVRFTLDDAATIHLKLTAKVGEKRIVLARQTRQVKRGSRTLRLRASKKTLRRLRARKRNLRARLEIRIVTPGSADRVLRRTVRLRRKS